MFFKRPKISVKPIDVPPTVLNSTYDAFSRTVQRPSMTELSPEEVKHIQTECELILKNDVFQRIHDELLREKAEDIIQTVDTQEMLVCKRHRMLGVDDFYKRVQQYAQQSEPPKPFDKFAVI